jgi:hypothetical protein
MHAAALSSHLISCMAGATLKSRLDMRRNETGCASVSLPTATRAEALEMLSYVW